MAARPARRRRRNPKDRKVLPPPAEVSLAEVARKCRYVGSPYHRTIPGPAGRPVYRPGKSSCPKELQRNPRLVQCWLEDAVRRGHCGEFERGFPRLVWRRDGEMVFEARQGTPGSGEYHGYVLEPDELVRGLELE